MDAAVACVPAAFPGVYRQRLFRNHDVCAFRRGHPLGRRLRECSGFLAARHEEYLLHPARAHDDAGGRWLRGLVKEVGAALERAHPIEAS